MKVSIQEDMWEVMRALPDDQGGMLARALVEYGFTGEEPEACPDAWYFAFLAFRGRIELSARQSAGGSKGASGRWGRGPAPEAAAGDGDGGAHGEGAAGAGVTPTTGADGCARDTHDGCAMGTHGTPTMGVGGRGADTHDAESEKESEKESERKDDVGHGEDAKVRDASARFVGRLNELAGTSFSPDSAQTLRLVSGRLRDGHTAEELCAVAEVKCRQWLRKPDMRGYLRPQTLLRASNFEGYLQEAVRGRASPFAAYDVEPDAVIGGRGVMGGAMDLPDLIRRHGASVPQEQVWAANTMTREEFDRAAREDREQVRAFLARGNLSAEERAQRLLDEATAAARIPERFAHVPVDRRLSARLRRGRGLYVWGATGGSGKTWAACAAVRGWIADGGRGALFCQAVSMLDDCRSAMTDGRGERAATSLYASARLLVVDDVGKEAPSPWTLAKLFEVADRRYGARLPTVWTSQLSPARLAERLASRGDELTAQAVVSRIVDSCDVVEDRAATAAWREGQMSEGSRPRVDHAVLTVFLEDGRPLVYTLSSAQARQVALLAREYEAADAVRGGGAVRSRTLTRLESIACYRRWRRGASKLSLAADYGVSVAAVSSAIDRVTCGRYGRIEG